MSYNDIVSKLREIARDQLRMEAISKLRDRLFCFIAEKTDFEESLVRLNKCIAIKNYQLSKLEDANPQKDDLQKDYEAAIKDANECIVEFKKNIEDVNKNIADINDKIAKWEKGETKVDAEKMEAISADLVKLVTNEAARSLCEGLPTPEDKKGAETK